MAALYDRSMRKQLAAIVAVSLSLVACVDDGGGNVGIDAPVDAAREDAPGGGGCTVSMTEFGERSLPGRSFYHGDTSGVGDIRAIMPLEPAEPQDILIVELYPGYAPFGTTAAPTAVVPGTYELTGTQLQYSTCGVCVRIGTNATDQGYEHDYMATGGTVTVTQVDNRVGGALVLGVANLQFEHVTIDEQTFESSPVGDGCVTALVEGFHESEMTAPPMKPGGTAAPLQRARQ